MKIPQIAVLCDFDGTIVTIDTALYVLQNFASDEDWKIYDLQFEREEISLEECLQKQFATLNTSPSEIISALEKVIVFQPNFVEFVNYCLTSNYPFVVVSAGLDFIIKHFLSNLNILDKVAIIAANTRVKNRGISFDFPPLAVSSSKNFKEDTVLQFQKKGFTVVFIGDGSGDFAASKRADFRFVIKHSKLEDFCYKEGIFYYTFSDFHQIIQELSKI